MAKSTGVFGILSGKIANTVWAYVKGQQTVRGYNPSPANPRSEDQETQRSRFDSAVQYGIALNRYQVMKDIWSKRTENPLTEYNKMVSEQLMSGKFLCETDEINILPANGAIVALEFGSVNPITVSAGSCTDGDYSSIVVVKCTGCGTEPSGYLVVDLYNQHLLADPDQSPIRDVKACVGYYKDGEEPSSIVTQYPVFDECIMFCDDDTYCANRAIFFIPVLLTDEVETGTMPTRENIIGVGVPAMVCIDQA